MTPTQRRTTLLSIGCRYIKAVPGPMEAKLNETLYRLHGSPGVVPCRKTGRPGVFPVSASTWWKWVRAGKAPRPIHIEGCAFWRGSDLAKLTAGAGE